MYSAKHSTARGFTLIELVVVIVILGILAAVAVPRFLDLTSDANESAIEALGGTMISTADLYYSKAAVNANDGGLNNGYVLEGILFDQGYPVGVSFGDSDNIPEILEAMKFSSNFVYATQFNDTTTNNEVARGLYITNKLEDTTPTVAEVTATNCYVTYKSLVTVSKEPEVTIVTTGC